MLWLSSGVNFMSLSFVGSRRGRSSFQYHNDNYTHVPLYTVKGYGEDLYRVIKVKSQSVYIGEKRKHELIDDEFLHKKKALSALARARSAIREYGLCNEWKYFVTLTLDKSKVDRYHLQDFLKEFCQWIQNKNKNGCRIQYCFVPEEHDDGAWHFHGFMNGINVQPQPIGTPLSIVNENPFCWLDYSFRYGYSTVEEIRSPIACGFYITKYMNKNLGKLADMTGTHLYYHSRGLSKSYTIGYHWLQNDCLDKFLKNHGEFCSTGFFKLTDVGYAVDLCDDVCENYRSYVLTDPDTEEVIAISNVAEPERFWEIFLGDQLSYYQEE